MEMGTRLNHINTMYFKIHFKFALVIVDKNTDI